MLDGVTQTATEIAAQTGRLDFLSALLASISVALVLGGIFAFLNFRQLAKKHAKKEATEVAKNVAERVVNKYLQENMVHIIDAYKNGFTGTHTMTDDQADEMGLAENLKESVEK